VRDLTSMFRPLSSSRPLTRPYNNLFLSASHTPHTTIRFATPSDHPSTTAESIVTSGSGLSFRFDPTSTSTQQHEIAPRNTSPTISLYPRLTGRSFAATGNTSTLSITSANDRTPFDQFEQTRPKMQSLAEHVSGEDEESEYRPSRSPSPAASSAAPPASSANIQYLFSDASYAPTSFSGQPSEDADKWLRKFNYYVTFRLFKLLMSDVVGDWLESQSSTVNISPTTLARHNVIDQFQMRHSVKYVSILLPSIGRVFTFFAL